MALMDPYGLELFPVEWWGVVLGVASSGFIIGGLLVAKFGLGRNPIRTMLILVIVMGAARGRLFTIREFWWLYAVGILLYMCLIPAVEAAEQTVIQKVVPFKTQGRVFGFAQAFEAAAAPITAFLIAPIAQFLIIPYMNSDAGAAGLGLAAGRRQGARDRAGVPVRRPDHGGGRHRRVLHPLVPADLRAVRGSDRVRETG